jgi:hypothetical protein
MSETLNSANVQEMLRPTVTPEMGFQSYEMLNGDTAHRKAQEEAFLNNDAYVPTLDYPYIDQAKLESGTKNLDRILAISREMPDADAADAVWDSASYRMAEMYWLMEAKRMNELSTNPTSEAFKQSAERYQNLNEELYGVPDEELIRNLYGEILAQAKSKNLHLSARLLLSELSFGTTVDVAGRNAKVPGILGEQHGRLPENMGEKLKVLGEVLREEFADVITLVNNYYESTVRERSGVNGDAAEFTVQDAQALFEAVHAMRDPENKSGISIKIQPNANSISWDTPSMSIQIGENRRRIDSVQKMIGLIVHEYGVHAIRAVNGLKTDLPVLGTGIYSEADPGENSDYLSFEEAFATLCEMALNESEEGWEEKHIGPYLAVAAAYRGLDFRQAFEINWRARVLMAVKDDEAVTEDILKKQRKQAMIAVRRIYRGTPTQLVDDRPVLTYNKDLAYLGGKIYALKYLEMVGDDKSKIKRLFAGKFDPLNHRQDALVQKFVDNAAA